MTATPWQNLPDMFFSRASREGNKPFLWGKSAEKRWRRRYQPISWTAAAARVSALSRGLRDLGVMPGNRVLLCAENRPEWALADLAIMAAGAVTVAADPNAPVTVLRRILGDSGARIAISSTALIAGRLLQAAEKETELEFIVAIELPLSGEAAPTTLVRWSDVIAMGNAEPDDVQAFVSAIGGDQPACILYTPGTSGKPKGVMLSHRAILANCLAARRIVPGLTEGKEVFLSYLPLHHAYEHTLGLMLPISIGAQIFYAERADRVAVDLARVRPTILTSIPRLYQVLYQRLQSQMARQSGWRAKLFDMALKLGKRRYEAGGHLPPWQDLLDRILDRLVRAPIQARFGGRLKAMFSGGSALPYEVALFFTALGLPILQGYGQTEAGPLISCNAPGGKLDTVGRPCVGVEIKLADDGEILVRGDMVMLGYWRHEAETAEALRDGWLHTGDLGSIDDDGYLRITDRKKDVIITAGGVAVSPQHVQDTLTLRPEIDQAAVFGDALKHLVAVVVPSERLLRSLPENEAARPGERQADLRQAMATAIESVNEELTPDERINGFVLAQGRFTPENGLLTPTQQVRREAVLSRYRTELDALKAERPQAGADAS